MNRLALPSMPRRPKPEIWRGSFSQRCGPDSSLHCPLEPAKSRQVLKSLEINRICGTVDRDGSRAEAGVCLSMTLIGAEEVIAGGAEPPLKVRCDRTEQNQR